jgi:Domain of unknown function (DUF4404)
MPDESLAELLQRVRARLQAGDAPDGESRRLLGSVVQDIERTLGRPAVQPAAASAHGPRLESLAVKFEASHPALAETLRELMDALVKAGI